jgi:hypothetical protein
MSYFLIFALQAAKLFVNRQLEHGLSRIRDTLGSPRDAGFQGKCSNDFGQVRCIVGTMTTCLALVKANPPRFCKAET